MLSELIDTHLAQIDNLDELKVTLAAYALLARRQIDTASITERDLLAHPAVRDGLRLPAITLKPALMLACARGSLLAADIAGTAHYFASTPASRAAVSLLQRASQPEDPDATTARALSAVGREIERLEAIEFYPPEVDDPERIAEWLARGYTTEEIISAARKSLHAPRAKNVPHRTLNAVGTTLTASPPAAATHYYKVVIARTQRPPEEIIALRERLRRPPTHDEFQVVRTAVGMFGLRATLDALGDLTRSGGVELSGLIPLLAERETAALETAREQSTDENTVRELIRLYEQRFGLPPTALVAQDMRVTLTEVPDLERWKAVFDYAARQNKRDWRYVRKVLLNPSPDVFTPAPVNDTAKHAFELYRRRVNRVIDPAVATEINGLSEKIVDVKRWDAAFDRAASANALRWDYLRSVLTSDKPEKKNDAKRPSAPKTGRTTYRRQQVEYDDEQRKAAQERARERLKNRK
jgi:hypothetical protein